MQVFIYGLIDPTDGVIKYVGATTKKYTDRIRQHIHEATKRESRKDNIKNKWIKSLKQKGLEPIGCLLSIESEESWKEKEKFYISFFQEHLTNSNCGGSSLFLKGKNRSLESIQRSANAHKIPIIQLDKHGRFVKEWDSIKSAAKSLNTTSTNISNVLNGVTHTAKGFRWIKKKDYHPNISFKANQGFTLCKATHKVTKTEILFDSLKECGEYFNISNSWISKSLNKEGSLVIKDFIITKC